MNWWYNWDGFNVLGIFQLFIFHFQLIWSWAFFASYSSSEQSINIVVSSFFCITIMYVFLKAARIPIQQYNEGKLKQRRNHKN